MLHEAQLLLFKCLSNSITGLRKAVFHTLVGVQVVSLIARQLACRKCAEKGFNCLILRTEHVQQQQQHVHL